VRRSTGARGEVVGKIAVEKGRDAESAVLLDVGELVGEELAARPRIVPDLEDGRAREKDVAPDHEGVRAEERRRSARQPPGMEARPRSVGADSPGGRPIRR